jgi:hypothetical protein
MRVTQERDRLHELFISLAALGVVVAILGGSGIAWKLLGATERGISREEEFKGARFGRPPDDLNAVEMHLFPQGAVPDPSTASARRLLEYGWSNRELGTVRIPIDRAALLYLGGQRAAVPRAAPADPTRNSAQEPE